MPARTDPAVNRSRRLSLGVVALCAGAFVASCGAPCRGVETRALALECAATSAFSGELHFDSEETFDTFLRQQCLDAGDDALADQLLAGIDFRTEAVFVVRGRHAIDSSRCLASREVARAEVCSTGLKLYFEDELQPVETCPATRWTVALVLDREDLRAALDAAETSP